MNKKILIIFFMFLVLTMPVFSANTTYSTCTGTTSITYNYTTTDGTEENITTINNCSSSCNSVTGRCYPEPDDINIFNAGIMIGLSMIAFIFVFLSSQLTAKLTFFRESKNPLTIEILQPLFLSFAFLVMLIDLNIMIELTGAVNMADVKSSLVVNYQGVWYIFWFLILYFLVSFIYHLFMSVGGSKKRY